MHVRNLCEEARNANTSVAPEVTRLQIREAQQPTRASAVRNQATEWHGQLQNLHQENTLINTLMNKIQITNSSMNTRIQDLTQQLQQLSRLQAGVSYLRTSVERNQSTENRDAENLRNCRKKILPELGIIFGSWPRLNASFPSCKKPKGKPRVFNLSGKMRKIL